jgi:hypothetical protein
VFRGFGVSGFSIQVEVSGFRVSGFRFRFPGFVDRGFGGLGFRVSGAGTAVDEIVAPPREEVHHRLAVVDFERAGSGFGFRVQGFGCLHSVLQSSTRKPVDCRNVGQFQQCSTGNVG